MNTKIAVLVFGFLVFLTAHVADAQQPAKVPRIGVLLGQTASFLADRMDELRQGLRELGYNEGENITLEYRYAEGDIKRFPGFVDEMIRLKVDIILAGGGTPSVLAAKKATSTIPIIFIGSTDPVAAGFVPSLERPGGNVTGLAIGGPGEYGKRAELLKETIPGLSRVGLLFNSAQSPVALELRKVTQTLGLQVQPLDVRAMISTVHSKRQRRHKPAVSLWRTTPPLRLTQNASSSLPRKAGYRRYTRRIFRTRLAGSWHIMRASMTCTDVAAPILIRFSKAPSQGTCPWSNQRSFTC